MRSDAVGGREAVPQHRSDDPFGTVINAALPMNGHKVKHDKALPHDAAT